MSQVLNIFKKDTRHLWPEVLLSLAITIAFAWIYPSSWTSLSAFVRSPLNLHLILAVLILISWAILIPRLIHDEALVGDRQFWITRPYSWPPLVAAKALFLVVFLYLPLLLAYCNLLYRAGFSPLSFVPGLLYNLLLITGILVLPLVAIATVTSTFPRMLLTLLAVLLVLIGLIATGPKNGVSLPHEWNPVFVLSFCVLITIILFQYSSRRTLISRLLLLGAAVFIIAFPFKSPGAAALNRAYPTLAAFEQPPVQLIQDPARQPFVTPGELREKEINLAIPLLVSGIAPDAAIKTDDITATIETPNGLRFAAPWRSAYQDTYLSTTTRSASYVVISRSFYDQVKAMPLTIRLTFALSQLHAGTTNSVPLSVGELNLPNVGHCIFYPHVFGRFFCLSPLRDPHFTLIKSVLSPCPEGPSFGASGTPGHQWVGSFSDEPASFGITSVWKTNIFLSGQWVNGTQLDFCPGVPLLVTPYTIVRRFQTSLVVSNIHIVERTPRAEDYEE